MQEKLTIARPYAQAAFDEARAEGKLDDWSAALWALAACVGNADFVAVMDNPQVARARLTELVLAVLGKRLEGKRANLARLLVEAHRLYLAPEIAQVFDNLRAAAGGQQEVEVRSPYPLDAAERQLLAGKLRARLGREVRLEVVDDPTLIGGVVIRAGDTVIDLSARGRLSRIAGGLP
jgi:F-type H+-transporting ATPase subunit delta